MALHETIRFICALCMCLVQVSCIPDRNFPFKICKNSKTLANIMTRPVVRSFLECTVLCYGLPNCFSVNYHKSTRTCDLSESWIGAACGSLTTDSNSRFAEFANPCLNGATWNRLSKNCTCVRGFIGPNCHRRWRDCSEVESPTIFTPTIIQPLGSSSPVTTYCDFTGIGIFIQMAPINGATENKVYQDYKDGFADTNGAYFGGLESMHQMTLYGEYFLIARIVASPYLNTIAKYTNVRIGSEAEGYPFYYDSFDPCYKPVANCTIVLDAFSGNGDPTKNINGSKFGAKDKNDVYGCAVANKLGWWYNTGCMLMVPNYTTKRLPWPVTTGVQAETGSATMRLVAERYYIFE